MTTKHTPGPWEWFERQIGRPYLATPDRGHLYVMGFERKGMQGATPVFAHWTGLEGGAPRDRKGGIMENGLLLRDGSMHPDARLIAATPLLLEALIAEQEWRDREAAGALDPEWDYEILVGAKRRAAIAAATGAPQP